MLIKSVNEWLDSVGMYNGGISTHTPAETELGSEEHGYYPPDTGINKPKIYYIGNAQDDFNEEKEPNINKESEEKILKQYLLQTENGNYKEIIDELFDLISNEGWLDQLEEEYKTEYTKDDFEYIELKITNDVKKNLMKYDELTLELFNEFDIKLKEQGEYPYDTLDFIDYEKGIIYIIRLI